MTEKVHVDIVISIRGGVYGPDGQQNVAVHGDVDGEYTSVKRMREIASMLFEAAWEVEEAANDFERSDAEKNDLRVFEDKAGNHWFEVEADKFYCASDLEEAQSLFASGSQHASEKSLRQVNKDKLKEIK